MSETVVIRSVHTQQNHWGYQWFCGDGGDVDYPTERDTALSAR